MPDQPKPTGAPSGQGKVEKPSAPGRTGAHKSKGEEPAKPPLTAEEQMALYEDDLKESDWGHQPC